MKKYLTFALIALFGQLSFAANPLAPDTKFQGVKNELPSGSKLTNAGTVVNTGTIQTTTGSVKIGELSVGIPFVATATITSAAAATAVEIVPDSAVPAGKKIYVTGFHAKVNGATEWATTATVKIQDTNGTPVEFATMAVAALTANALVFPMTSNITPAAAFTLGTGGTVAKGLVLKGDANGTGSDLVVTVYGFIK